MRIVAPTDENIAEAASAIRSGRLVVMPTETVYGLAADALNRDAVLDVFAAKGRPSDNPLIVHLAETTWLSKVARDIPEVAYKLANRFWPGPLTLVLLKLPIVPMEVSAGLDTVAVRVPAHSVARRLILEAGTPVAAPSANLFTRLSPTRAEHVDPSIGDSAELVLDGGSSEVGLESTVLDLTDGPRILRPGGVSQAELEAFLGMPIPLGTGVRKSPGQYPRHYSPRTPVEIVPQLQPDQAGLVLSALTNPAQVLLPHDPVAYAALLYETLFDLDQIGLDRIYVEAPPQTRDWDAVWDRLKKAAMPSP